MTLGSCEPSDVMICLAVAEFLYKDLSVSTTNLLDSGEIRDFMKSSALSGLAFSGMMIAGGVGGYM